MLRFAFRSSVFASLLLTTALALPATAAEPFKPEGWQTGIMRKPDGSFAYCVSESKFEENLWLILALTPTGDVNLGVGQKGANLPVGNEKPVRIRVDGNPPQEMTARAVKPELMVINAGQSSRLLEMISRGNMMNVDNMSFSLAGSGKAVETLRECVQASAGSAPAVTLNGAPAASMTEAAEAQVAAPAPAVEAPAAPVAVAQAPAVEAPAVETPAPVPAPVAATAEVAPPIVQSPVRADIKWNPSPIAMPGQRDANTLPPSMQQAQAQLPVPTAVAEASAPAVPAPTVPTAPAAETVIASTSAPVEAPAPAAIDQSGLAPELTPPTPDTRIVTVPAQQADAVPAQVAAAVPEPILPASTPLATPAIKPLPAQLERLLTTANLREVEAAPVTENDIAFAWKSRDMLGNVREVAVPAGSNIVQLAGQHFSMLKARCDVQFSASLGQPQNTGALQILTGSTTCRGNGKSHYTTLVFALSQQGVLSIIANNIDQGRRAAPDRAQSGIVEALKATQG